MFLGKLGKYLNFAVAGMSVAVLPAWVILLSINTCASCVPKQGIILKMERDKEVIITIDKDTNIIDMKGEVIFKVDGKISMDERNGLANLIYGERQVEYTNMKLRVLINDVNLFVMGRMRDRNLSWRNLKKLSLYTVSTHRELEESHDSCSPISEKMPKDLIAFYCPNNEEIVIYENKARYLISTFFHEWGHYQRSSGDGKYPTLTEFSAEGLRIWLIHNIFAMDRVVGFLFVADMLYTNIPLKTYSDSINDIDKYRAAALGFYIAANKYNGDLDRAMNFILSGKRKNIKKMFKDTFELHKGKNAQEIWIHEVTRLINSKGYRNYLIYLFSKGNLDTFSMLPPKKITDTPEARADDFIEFMKMRAEKIISAL